MARDWFDTGNHGIALGLEYGSLVDSATGGAITADTVNGKVSNLEAWIKTDDWPFTDSSNKLSWSGALVNEGSDSNISAGTSSSKKLKELTPQAIALKFGSTVSGTVSLSLTGIEAAGETLSGSRTFTFPARPYHLPAIPSTAIDGVAYYCGGNQNDPALDSYWQYTDWYLETNDVLAIQYANLPGSQTGVNYAAAANSRYRGFVVSKNASGNGAAYTGYYYTAPATPTGLAAARRATKTSVLLTWVNNARYVAGYLIERSLNGGAYSQIGSSGSASYTDTSVPLGSTATYRVRVQSPTGSNTAYSAYSATAAVTYGWAAPDAPATALLTRNSDAAATATITGNQTNAALDKYWSYVDGETQTDDAAFVASHTGMANTTTEFAVSGLAANKRYCFRARSVNPAGYSAYRTAGYIYTTPAAPADFTAARESSASSTVLLAWTNPAPWASLWIVERSTNGGASWTQLGTTATPNYSDTLSVASSALYRVRAQTPAPAVQSANSPVILVGMALISDKAKMPGIDHIYVGTDRIRRVLTGATQHWVDGDE